MDHRKEIKGFEDKISPLILIPVVQEYQNENSPTFNGPNKPKTSGKPIIIVADLQPTVSTRDKPESLYPV